MKYKEGDKVVTEIKAIKLNAWKDTCYKILDKYIIPIDEVEESTELLSKYIEPLEAKIRRQAAEITRLLEENKRLKAENGNVVWEIEQAFDRGIKAGQNEAWELARKIILRNGYTSFDLDEIFNCCGSYQAMENFTYQEAAAKVAEWEKAKEEIKVGDVYKNECGNCFVICDVNEEDNNAQVLWSSSLSSRKTLDEITRYYTKTGRHIDIEGLLKQIGGEE